MWGQNHFLGWWFIKAQPTASLLKKFKLIKKNKQKSPRGAQNDTQALDEDKERLSPIIQVPGGWRVEHCSMATWQGGKTLESRVCHPLEGRIPQRLLDSRIPEWHQQRADLQKLLVPQGNKHIWGLPNARSRHGPLPPADRKPHSYSRINFLPCCQVRVWHWT